MDTKGMFSGALMRLLETRCIDDITVGDIVEESGLGRSTFYKHFADKYELARWTHVSNQRPIMSSYFEEGGQLPFDAHPQHRELCGERGLLP